MKLALACTLLFASQNACAASSGLRGHLEASHPKKENNAAHQKDRHLITCSFHQTTEDGDLKNAVDNLSETENICGPIGTWDVSGVTNMEGLFSQSFFNEDISNWDTSSVTTFENMFHFAHSFNQPIGGWDTSKVVSMSNMFRQSEFNQPIGNWDTSSVTTFEKMFGYARSFNQPIGGWDTSKVQSMAYMLQYANSFNQPIGDWDTSSVTTLRWMFQGEKFNQPIGNWDTSKVVDMYATFYDAAFNQDISAWDTSSVENMEYLFESNHGFNQPLSTWDVSKVTSMYGAFYDSVFNNDLSAWELSSCSNMGSMFEGNHVFNQDISDWDVSNVENMNSLFDGATNFDQELCWGYKLNPSVTTVDMFTDSLGEIVCYDGPGWTVVLDEESFENAADGRDGPWGSWECHTPGNADCRRVEDYVKAASGDYSVKLRNNDAESAMFASFTVPVNTYTQGRVVFSFYAESYNTIIGGGFFVETPDGTKHFFNIGEDFSNSAMTEAEVVFPLTGVASPMQITFQGNGIANSMAVYIDSVKVEAQ